MNTPSDILVETDIFAYWPPQVAQRVADAAMKRHWRVMTAESCTGGLAAAALTALPGASYWFHGGVAAYSNDIKQQILKIPAAVLEQFGAVSEQTARAMCEGLVALGAQAGVSITGIAGPDGGDAQKPVGTVCFGFCTPERQDSITQYFKGDRDAIRGAATIYALDRLAAAMESSPR